MGVCPYPDAKSAERNFDDMLNRRSEWLQLTKHNLPTLYKYLKTKVYFERPNAPKPD